ncbi:MAG: PEP-CTERM sorting domain-containing protein [Acidobacteriota bacterium]|nr:PEP-CTERM sorting domain-containing protein [Acidobacteriota bacterium]
MWRTAFGGVMNRLILVAWLAVGAATAPAASITYNSNVIPYSSTDWGVNPVPSKALIFQGFNSGLGTLNSVELILNGTFQTTITITNLAEVGNLSLNGGVTTESDMTIQDPLNLLPDSNSNTGQDVSIFSTVYNPNNGIVGAGVTYTSGLLTGSQSTDSTYTAANILNEFTTSGPITFTASTFTTSNYTIGTGNYTISQATKDALSGQVIYNYTAASTASTPEPATMVLMVSALVGLGFFRSKSR